MVKGKTLDDIPEIPLYYTTTNLKENTTFAKQTFLDNIKKGQKELKKINLK